MRESGQRSLKPADHVFPCNPAVKAGNGASSTACKIHDHLRSFISKRLMPTMFPALGWEGSGAMEMKLWIPSLRVMVRWGTQMSGLDNVAWRAPRRTPEKHRGRAPSPAQPGGDNQCVALRSWIVSSQKIHGSLNLHYLRMWPYLDLESLQR